MRIVLAGGGTGGHVFPLIAVAENIRSKTGNASEFLYIGPKGVIENSAFQSAGIPIRHILCGKFRRYFSMRTAGDLFRIPIGFIQSLWILLFYMPDAVFSKGGYASVPVVLAAWIYRIPVLVHESDARPGIANRILAKFSERVAISYESSKEYFPKEKVGFTGIPVRTSVLHGEAGKARELFRLSESKPVVLVLGGSQGSRALNSALAHVLSRLLHLTQVIHQTGKADYERALHLAGEYGVKAGREGYVAEAFLEDEKYRHAVAVADLVVSRAGASAIAEIAAAGKPVVLVPLSSAANDHQRMNAYEVAQLGGALVLEESNLGPELFYEKIHELLLNENLRSSMGEKIRSMYHPDAVDVLAQGVIEIAT